MNFARVKTQLTTTLFLVLTSCFIFELLLYRTGFIYFFLHLPYGIITMKKITSGNPRSNLPEVSLLSYSGGKRKRAFDRMVLVLSSGCDSQKGLPGS